MDEEKTIAELKQKVRSFCEVRDWDQYHNAKDLAIGIITESSELLEHFRFKTDGQVEELFENSEKSDAIKDEMADILFFLLRLAQRYDIDLSAALSHKIEKNEKKYPAEKVKGKNKKYTEY